jgi:hypothetical protein
MTNETMKQVNLLKFNAFNLGNDLMIAFIIWTEFGQESGQF